MGTKVVACAIVKDEPKFGRTVLSMQHALGSALAGLVVHNTGSNDSRPVYVSNAPSWNRFRPFDDFSSARNACLADAAELAYQRGADWLFMFSAGAEFSGRWAPPDTDAEALQHTEVLGDFSYAKICTIAARSKLRFRGLTHEVIDAGVSADKLPHCGLTVDYSGDWDPEKKRARWELDATLLEHDYSPRGRFYLAQSYQCLGRYPEAFATYAFRCEQGGLEPERLQAIANAVTVAPSLFVARCMTHLEHCADAYLALAEREFAVKNFRRAHRAAFLANSCTKRSMFTRRDLHLRALELAGMCENQMKEGGK